MSHDGHEGGAGPGLAEEAELRVESSGLEDAWALGCRMAGGVP